jgi:small subunit ribosomal protein S13e
MHAPGKGIASSALPYRRTPPSWLKTSPEEVVEQITKLARKGLSPSQIGVILRDSHGIPQVRLPLLPSVRSCRVPSRRCR